MYFLISRSNSCSRFSSLSKSFSFRAHSISSLQKGSSEEYLLHLVDWTKHFNKKSRGKMIRVGVSATSFYSPFLSDIDQPQLRCRGPWRLTKTNILSPLSHKMWLRLFLVILLFITCTKLAIHFTIQLEYHTFQKIYIS